MTSMNSKDDISTAPATDSKPSVLSKQKLRIESFQADDMCVLLENVYSLHQEVSNGKIAWLVLSFLNFN